LPSCALSFPLFSLSSPRYSSFRYCGRISRRLHHCYFISPFARHAQNFNVAVHHATFVQTIPTHPSHTLWFLCCRTMHTLSQRLCICVKNLLWCFGITRQPLALPTILELEHGCSTGWHTNRGERGYLDSAQRLRLCRPSKQLEAFSLCIDVKSCSNHLIKRSCTAEHVKQSLIDQFVIDSRVQTAALMSAGRKDTDVVDAMEPFT